MRIGVIQLDIRLGEVEWNLRQLQVEVRDACERGAEMVLLPEFFTSGMAYYRTLLSVPRYQARTRFLLGQLAADYGVAIGGSFLTFDGSNAHNEFFLVFPDGTGCTHQKDIPTMVENAYYVGGRDDGVFHTPMGRIGVALCWEMLRWNTVRRMVGKVDFVLAASCWWGRRPRTDAPLAETHVRNLELLHRGPQDLARLLGVPVAHASSVGKFMAANLRDPRGLAEQCFLGHSQIVASNGTPVATAHPADKRTVLVSDIKTGGGRPHLQSTVGKYWIPQLTEVHLSRWDTERELGAKYYREVARPRYMRG